MGPPVGEEEDRCEEKRRPEPRTSADEGEALPEVAEQRRPLVAGEQGARAQKREHDGGDRECPRVEEERFPWPEGCDDPPAEGWAEQHESERTNELIERVRLQEKLTRDDLGHDRRERRAEERVAGPEHSRHHDEVPELDRARQGEDPDDGDGQSPHQVGGDHDSATLDAIGDDPAEQDEDAKRQGPGQTDDREGRGRVREVVDLPGERDEIDPVADERDGHARPEESEVPDPQSGGDPDRGRAGLQVPRPPNRANGLEGITSQTSPPPGSTSMRDPDGASRESSSASMRASSSFAAPTSRKV
jgi:hypothetical protein